MFSKTSQNNKYQSKTSIPYSGFHSHHSDRKTIDSDPGRLYNYVLPYLFLVTIHIVMGINMQQPSIFPDEAGYLGRARYLSGIADIIQGTGFYHFGYSLFLLPAFWLFSNPKHAYSAVMVINALLMSSLYLVLYYTLHTLFDYPRRIKFLIAFTVCLYPAFLLQSNIAWSENAFVPFYATFVTTAGAVVKRKSWGAALFFGLLSGFLYTIHPRALLILPISIAFLLFLAATNMLKNKKALVSSITVFLIFMITRYVNDFLSASLDGGRTVDNYIMEKIVDTLSPANWLPMLLEASGQLLYLIEATYGLFLVGLMYTALIIWKNLSTDGIASFHESKFAVLIILLLSSATIFLSSSVSILPVDAGSKLIYGRYNEGFLALYLAFGLVGIYESCSFNRFRAFINLFGISILILILSGVILTGYDYASLTEWCKVTNLNIVEIFGIYPYIGVFRNLPLFITALFTILLMSILIGILRTKFVSGLCFLMVCFIGVTASGYTVLYVRSEYIKNITTLKYHIQSLGNIKSLSYDRSFFDSETWFSYQYSLPHVVFNTFYSDHNQLPRSQVVISGIRWQDAKELNAQLLASENQKAQVPPIIRKLIEMFFSKPLEQEKQIDQALWLLEKTNEGNSLLRYD